MSAERSSPDAEVESFFALPRWVLYAGALVVLAWIAAMILVTGTLMSRGQGPWALALFPLTGLLATALLYRSRAGRGCLRTVGLGWGHHTSKLEPRSQVILWAIASVIGLGVAVAMTGG